MYVYMLYVYVYIHMYVRNEFIRELAVRHAGFAVRHAKKLFEMQSCCIPGRKTCMSASHFHRSAGRFCISSCKTCMSARHFHHSAGPFTLLLLHYFMSIISSRQEVFASRAANPACRPAIFTSWPDRLRFCCFAISFPYGSKPARRPAIFTSRPDTLLFEGFCISGRNTCIAIFTGRPDPLLFYGFTISCPLGSRQKVFASRAAKHACRPAIFTSRTGCLLFYCFSTVLLSVISFSYRFQAGGFYTRACESCMSACHFHQSAGPFTISLSFYFPFASRQEAFASRAVNPACRPAIFTSRPDPLLFYYFAILFS